MNLNISDRASEQLAKLPVSIRKKANKNFNLLINNYRHPSLRSRKMAGTPYYEARVDIHYRFIFEIENEMINIIAVGPHDEGLGKK